MSRSTAASASAWTKCNPTSPRRGGRADARPNFGDYNSSVLLGNGRLALVWADGRFTPVAGTPATPDTIFSVATGLGDD